MPTIVATYVCASSQGQRTHSARSNTIVATTFVPAAKGSARTPLRPIWSTLVKVRLCTVNQDVYKVFLYFFMEPLFSNFCIRTVFSCINILFHHVQKKIRMYNINQLPLFSDLFFLLLFFKTPQLFFIFNLIWSKSIICI